MAGTTEIVSNTPMGDTLKDLWRMALYFSASKLFAFKTPEEAMAMMLIAHAEGRHPALAVRDYHIVQNRPALKSEAMLARFQQTGGIVKWSCHTDDKVSGLFIHPQSCPEGVDVEWDVARATKAKLINKENWGNYRRAMLRARVISEGVRAAYPACICGFYAPEELDDQPVVKAADFSVPDEKPVSKTESLKNRLTHRAQRPLAEELADAGEASAATPEPEPVSQSAPAPEPAPAPAAFEADVLTVKELIVCGYLPGKNNKQGAAIKKTVGEMDSNELQNALDLALLDQADATKAPRALGIIALVQAEIATRAN